LRLEKVFERVQSAWPPTMGGETFEIIRRRQFQLLDAEGENARTKTVKLSATSIGRNLRNSCRKRARPAPSSCSW
jgi:hypothetical protein